MPAKGSILSPYVNRICEECGVLFEIPPYNARHHPCRFCSRLCYQINRSETPWREMIKPSDANLCWIWPHSLNRYGYGKIKHNQVTTTAHRIAWEKVCGPVPEGMMILHTCDVRSCVRNDEIGVYIVNGNELPRRGHLFLGTAQHNMIDMYDKGRAVKNQRKGEDHPTAKVTFALAEYIRNRYERGGISMAKLAIEVGLAYTTVNGIVHKRRWGQ